MDTAKRFDALEGVRAILALWVLFSHALLQTGLAGNDLYWPATVVRSGGLAVVGFMIVSGFAISHLVIKGQESYGVYIWRRFLRLWPLLMVMTFVGIVMHTFWPAMLRYNDAYIVPYLITRVLMIHGIIPTQILPEAATAIVGPAWSISLEWQFYLIAPFLILSMRRFNYLPAFVLLVLYIFTRRGSWYLFGYEMTFDEGAFFPVRSLYFLLGIVSYQVIAFLDMRRLDAVAGSAIVLAVFLATKEYPIAIWTFTVLAMAGLREFNALLSSRTLMYLGKISFSIYLVHGFVLLAIRYFVVLPHFETGTLAFFLALTIPGLILTVAISHLTYRWVELPFINFGKYGALRKPLANNPVGAV